MAKKTSGQELVDALPKDALVPETPESAAPPVQEPEQTLQSPEVPQTPEPVAQEPEVTQPGFIDQIKKLGFADVEDETQARERLLQSYERQLQEMDRLKKEYERAQYLARIGEQYYSQMQDPSFAGQQAQRQDTPKQPANEHWWKAPQFDPQVAQRWRTTVVGADGQPRTEWRPETPLEIRNAHDKYTAYVEDWSEKLVHRPHEVLPQIIQQEVQPIIERILDERFGNIQAQSTLQQVTNEIRSTPWMFDVDPRTNQQAVDPVTGQPVYSEAGQMVLQEINRLEQQGLNDPRQVWELAQASVFYNTARQKMSGMAQQPAAQPAQPAAPAPTLEEKNKSYMQRAAQRSSSPPPRNAAVDPNNGTGPKAGRRQSPGHDLLAEMQKQGVPV